MEPFFFQRFHGNVFVPQNVAYVVKARINECHALIFLRQIISHHDHGDRGCVDKHRLRFKRPVLLACPKECFVKALLDVALFAGRCVIPDLWQSISRIRNRFPTTSLIFLLATLTGRIYLNLLWIGFPLIVLSAAKCRMNGLQSDDKKSSVIFLRRTKQRKNTCCIRLAAQLRSICFLSVSGKTPSCQFMWLKISISPAPIICTFLRTFFLKCLCPKSSRRQLMHFTSSIQRSLTIAG